MCECAECECECRFYTVRGEHSISVVKMCLQFIDCGTRVGNKSINRKAGPSEVCRGDLRALVTRRQQQLANSRLRGRDLSASMYYE